MDIASTAETEVLGRSCCLIEAKCIFLRANRRILIVNKDAGFVNGSLFPTEGTKGRKELQFLRKVSVPSESDVCMCKGKHADDKGATEFALVPPLST
jgi:hypothetical protein